MSAPVGLRSGAANSEQRACSDGVAQRDGEQSIERSPSAVDRSGDEEDADRDPTGDPPTAVHPGRQDSEAGSEAGEVHAGRESRRGDTAPNGSFLRFWWAHPSGKVEAELWAEDAAELGFEEPGDRSGDRSREQHEEQPPVTPLSQHVGDDQQRQQQRRQSDCQHQRHHDRIGDPLRYPDEIGCGAGAHIVEDRAEQRDHGRHTERDEHPEQVARQAGVFAPLRFDDLDTGDRRGRGLLVRHGGLQAIERSRAGGGSRSWLRRATPRTGTSTSPTRWSEKGRVTWSTCRAGSRKSLEPERGVPDERSPTRRYELAARGCLAWQRWELPGGLRNATVHDGVQGRGDGELMPVPLEA